MRRLISITTPKHGSYSSAAYHSLRKGFLEPEGSL